MDNKKYYLGRIYSENVREGENPILSIYMKRNNDGSIDFIDSNNKTISKFNNNFSKYNPDNSPFMAVGSENRNNVEQIKQLYSQAKEQYLEEHPSDGRSLSDEEIPLEKLGIEEEYDNKDENNDILPGIDENFEKENDENNDKIILEKDDELSNEEEKEVNEHNEEILKGKD